MDLLRKLKEYIWTKTFLKKTGIVFLFYFLVVLLTIFILDIYTNHGQLIKVPNLVGKNIKYAASKLEEMDLAYEVLDSIYDSINPAGTIILQDPMPTYFSGVHVKEDRIIRLRISKKTRLIEMPDLINNSQRFAENILKNRGLKFRIQYKPTIEASGAVLDQRYKGSPIKEGKKIPIGSIITLIVGRLEFGTPVDIPNLIGMNIYEARAVLDSLGKFEYLPVCPDCYSYEDSVMAKIYSQAPEFIEGMQVPGGATFQVYALKNPPEEPPSPK